MPLTDDINTGLLGIKALKTQYATKLLAYETAKNNYTNALTINTMNPCKTYLSSTTNISQQCYNKIWADQKCTTPAATLTSSASYSSILNWVFAKSKSNTDADKISCYGSSTSPILNTSATAVSSSHNSNLISVPEKTWTPGTGATTVLSTTASSAACMQTCVDDISCTGSTYNSTAQTNNCSLVRGPGILSSSSANNTAIIPQLTSYLLILKTLNDELIAIIDNIETKLTAMDSNLDAETAQLLDSSAFEVGFRSDYDSLITDRANIAELLAKHDDVLAAYDEKSLFANRENNSLRLWTIGAIVIVIFLIKIGFGLNSPAINTIFWTTVIVLIGLTLSNPTGFIGLGILFLIFLSFIIY